MKASDVMTSPAVTVDPDAALNAVAALLHERRISGVPVVDDDRLVGVVTEADLLHRGRAAEAGSARDVMTRDVATVDPDTPVEAIATLLASRGIKRVPVVRDSAVVGIVSRSNLVQALAVHVPSVEAPSDEAIRAALIARLERQPWWLPVESNVIVSEGIVHYWGRVESKPAREAALALAKRTPGVRGVEDHRSPAHEPGREAAGPATQVRRAADRGHSKHAWVDSWHSFSYGNYYDPAHRGYGPLRVLNEKRVQPSDAFTTYGVRDVEIVSYVLDGTLGHGDTLDNEAALPAGAAQRLSAGSGMRFSEMCRGDAGPCRFLQIWIEPERLGLAASYEQRPFASEEKRGRLRLIASPDGHEASLRLHQNARIYAGCFDGPERAALGIASGRRSYVHVARGALTVNGEALGEGDALQTDRGELSFEDGRGAELLVFDLPGERTPR